MISWQQPSPRNNARIILQHSKLHRFKLWFKHITLTPRLPIPSRVELIRRGDDDAESDGGEAISCDHKTVGRGAARPLATGHSDELSQDPDFVSLFGPQCSMLLLNFNIFTSTARIMYYWTNVNIHIWLQYRLFHILYFMILPANLQ